MTESLKDVTTESGDREEPLGDAGFVTGRLAVSALVLSVVALMAGSVLAWMAWHARVPSFSTVDIADVVKEKEAQFTALLSKPSVSDADRQAAYLLVQKLGPEIEQAVARIQRECSCTLLVKSAVVAGASSDLTPRLRELLGMQGGTR